MREITSSTLATLTATRGIHYNVKVNAHRSRAPVVLLFASPPASAPKAFGATKETPESQGQTGTLQKMIVENGSVTMDLDLNRLEWNQFRRWQDPSTLHFAAAANSFFTILVFNDLLRGPEPGSMALDPAGVDVPGYNNLPAVSRDRSSNSSSKNFLRIEPFDLAVRDGKTGFTFFNIEGHQYDYDANAQLLSITGGNLLVSKEFANALGRPSDAGALVGKISIGATMQPIEIETLVNGETKSVVMPALHSGLGGDRPALVPGPDVIVGDLPEVAAGRQRHCESFCRTGCGNDFLQQRRPAAGLVCIAKHRSPVHSAKSLSNERRT